jgi:hypothetical protein
MANEQLASDQVATPKTDAAEIAGYECDRRQSFVPADFARAQERRIAELESACQEIAELISGFDAMVFDDIAKVLLGTKP